MTAAVKPSCRGHALLLKAMHHRRLTQAGLTTLLDDVTRDLGKRTTLTEVNHVVAGRRRATTMLAVAIDEVLGIPVRAWLEPP